MYDSVHAIYQSGCEPSGLKLGDCSCSVVSCIYMHVVFDYVYTFCVCRLLATNGMMVKRQQEHDGQMVKECTRSV